MAEGGVDVDFGQKEQQEVREEENDDLEWDDEFGQNLDGQTQETSFGEAEHLGLEGLKNKMLKQKIDAFYSDIEKRTRYKPAITPDPNNFRLKMIYWKRNGVENGLN